MLIERVATKRGANCVGGRNVFEIRGQTISEVDQDRSVTGHLEESQTGGHPGIGT